MVTVSVVFRKNCQFWMSNLNEPALRSCHKIYEGVPCMRVASALTTFGFPFLPMKRSGRCAHMAKYNLLHTETTCPGLQSSWQNSTSYKIRLFKEQNYFNVALTTTSELNAFTAILKMKQLQSQRVWKPTLLSLSAGVNVADKSTSFSQPQVECLCAST